MNYEITNVFGDGGGGEGAGRDGDGGDGGGGDGGGSDGGGDDGGGGEGGGGIGRTMIWDTKSPAFEFRYFGSPKYVGADGISHFGWQKYSFFSIPKTSPMDEWLYGHSHNNFWKNLSFYMWMVKIAIFG